MELHFLPNYFTIGSLISSLFFLFVFYVLLRIKDPSKGTAHLKWTVTYMAIFNISYIVTHGFSEYPTIFTRWVNIMVAMGGTIHSILFFLNFPTPIKEKFSRKLLVILYVLSASVSIWILFVFWNSPFYYIFNAHFWDSDTLFEQKLAGLFIFFLFLLTLATGVWRSIVQKGEGKKTILSIVIAMAIVLVVPGIFHVLSRDGLLERSVYMTSTVIFNLTGFFIIVIVFINKTTDKTSILIRLIGVSVVTVLLILQVTSFFYLKSVEESFDRVHIALSKETFVEKKKHPFESYRLVYDPSLDSLVKESGRIDSLDKEERLRLLRNSSYLNQIKNMKPQDFPRNVESLLSSTHPDFRGYKGWIQSILQSGEVSDPSLLVALIEEKYNRVRYLNSKIRSTKPEKWEKEAQSILKSIPDHFPGFLEALSISVEGEDIPDREDLKKYLTPIRLPEYRSYAGDIEYKKGDPLPLFSLAYSTPIKIAGKEVIVETGLDYKKYREQIAESSITLIIIILSSYIFILLGFRFFFGGALLHPIESLVDGLKEVNSGNLDVNIPIQVEDEIGFMTRSFNNMAWSIKSSQEKLKEYAEQLEEKVEERTKELSDTLKKVQDLKAQQDGDYFLTTLLLEPLGFSEVRSSYINLESFVKQKKQFTFRKWSNNIGGDINIAQQITLNGKSHIAFVNADAMGKSMQGAGGALVMGSVFHTILDRTEMSPAMQLIYPEKWLKNLFVELHKVFESFNGSMLISGFFGLLDEESGFLYYLNCEHPKGVLYRDGKASFFEKDVVLRKLGTSSVGGTLKIETFQLELGDTIILGSDGRDDILTGHYEDGSRIINEDENIFLDVVEKSDGDLHKIVARLESMGELTDDLSLIRIERFSVPKTIEPDKKEGIQATIAEANDLIENENYEKAIEVLDNYSQNNPVSPEITKALSRLHYQVQNYEMAAKYAQDYLFMKPSDHEFLYFASLCFRRIKNYHKSIDISERLRLRNFNFSKNLGLLADLHMKMGNTKRAIAIYEELKEIDPDSQVTLYLQEKLESAQQA